MAHADQNEKKGSILLKTMQGTAQILKELAFSVHAVTCIHQR